MATLPYRLDDQIGHVLRRMTQRHLALFAAAIPEVTTTRFAVLARLGHVATAADPTDRRRLTVTLTASGEALFRARRAIAWQVTADTLSPPFFGRGGAAYGSSVAPDMTSCRARKAAIS